MQLLLVMCVTCLAAIWLVMAAATPGRRPVTPAPATTITSVLGDLRPVPAPEPPAMPEDPPSASELAPDAGAAEALADTGADVTAEAAPARRDMPGPALHPSPQYPDTVPPSPVGDAPGEADDTEADDAAAPAGQRRVTGSRVNLRAGPGTGHAVLGAVEGGDMVTPLAPEADGWQQVQTAAGQAGWLSVQFLSAPLP